MISTFPKSALLFLISPVLSIPLIFRDIYLNKKVGYILFAGIFFILSYFYIPKTGFFFASGGDKSYYINLYNFFLSLSFQDATLYIENNMTDVTFWYLILIFSHLGIPFPFLAGSIIGISLSILFYIFRKSVTENKLSKFMILTLFITLICSFHLPSLFDGLRFFFAQSFIILGFYLSLVRNQTLKGLTSLLFAATIHFSTVVFFIATLFYVLFQKNYKLLKVVYFFSFLFLFIPAEYFLIYFVNLLPYVDIDVIYLQKYLSYFSEKQFVITNTGHAIYVFFGKLWYYLITIYALLNINRSENKWFSTLLILLVFANMTFLFPFVFNRYGFIILVAFVFVVINDYKKYKFNNFFILSFLIISILTTCLDIIIERDSFEKSYARVGLLTLPTMILMDPTDGGIFDKGNLLENYEQD